MKYIEAISEEIGNKPHVFLAGGITNCPDWQSEVVKKLEEKIGDLDFTIFNPRRENFPIHDPNASKEQISWEYHRINNSNPIIFWFSRGSDNPIVLFEYGWVLAKAVYSFRSPWQIVVGCDPEYSRKNDVIIQTHLRDPSIKIHNSLDMLVVEAIQKIEFSCIIRSHK